LRCQSGQRSSSFRGRNSASDSALERADLGQLKADPLLITVGRALRALIRALKQASRSRNAGPSCYSAVEYTRTCLRSGDQSMTRAATGGARTYNAAAKLLHWSIAVLIVLQLGIGWTMPEIHKNTRPDGLIAWHVAVGVLIVLLVAARVVWRAVRPPTGADSERGAMRRLASATHILLYLLMIVVPVLGWAHANSRDWVVGIGPLHLPRIMAAGSKIGHEMGDIHADLAIVLAVVIGLHLAAGLYHQFIRRDDTLLRMM
jgi:cytochrome b561